MSARVELKIGGGTAVLILVTRLEYRGSFSGGKDSGAWSWTHTSI